MYSFVRFSDLGPFTNIVHSHPKYENTPSGLILDRGGRVVGHSMAPLATRRFRSYGGREGEHTDTRTTMEGRFIPTAEWVEDAIDYDQQYEEDEVDRIEEEIYWGPEDPDEGKMTQFFEEEMAKRQRAATRPRMRKRAPTPGSWRDVQQRKRIAERKAYNIKQASATGVRKSGEGDPLTATREAKKDARKRGLTKSEAKVAGSRAGSIVRKHSIMEVEEAVGEGLEYGTAEGKHQAVMVSRGGRAPGSVKGSSDTPRLNKKTQTELKALGKSMGFAPTYLRSRAISFEKIEAAAETAGVPVEAVLDAYEQKHPMPVGVREVVVEMEKERRGRARARSVGETSGTRRKTRGPGRRGERHRELGGFKVSKAYLTGGPAEAKRQAKRKKKK